MAVKLDVLVNYLFDNSKLKANIASLNKQMIAAWSPYSSRQILNLGQRGNLREYFERLRISAKQFNDILSNTRSQINALNTKGYFQPYLEAMGVSKRKNLKKDEVEYLSQELANQQVAEIQAIEEKKDKEFEENVDNFLRYERELEQADIRAKKARQKLEEKYANLEYKEEMDRIDEQSKLDAEKLKIEEKQQADYHRAQIRYENAERRKEEERKKKMFNLILGRWGKFGLWGIAVAKGIQYISKAMNYAYQTSMQGLDWQRTISGGASGGTWFGKDIAAYQRAGIGANAVQGFKRGIQGYLGQVKLGMGNAAPLMYLGLSAIDNLDDTEKQLESALRRLPKDVSLALAGQMGLNYEMWEAIYSGRLDRERSMYSEQAIQQWAELAKGFNEILTEVKTLFFNYFAPYAAAFGEFLQKLSEGKTGISSAIDIGTGFVSKVPQIAFRTVEVIVKNENGEVIGKGEAQPYIVDTGFQVPQQGS